MMQKTLNLAKNRVGERERGEGKDKLICIEHNHQNHNNHNSNNQ
jgi:hypothetical protein